MIIPGFDDYDITTEGVVTKVSSGETIQPVVTNIKGIKYLRVNLKSNSGQRRMHNVMKLVAMTYLQKVDHTDVVRAIDGNNLNVSIDNIMYISRRELTKQAWQDGKLNDRKPKPKCWSEDSIEYVYNVLCELGTITLSKLNTEMDLPFSTIRYSVDELCRRGLVIKTNEGLEVVP